MNADPTPPAASLPENPPAAPAGGVANAGCGILIVILVLVIVAGMHSLRETSRMAVKSKASAGVMAIFNAIGQFQGDYDRLPMPASAVEGADSDSETSAEEWLVAILLGRDGTQNFRKTNYLGDIKDAVMKEGKWRSGLIQNGENIALVDPWGNPYHIRLDGNGDGFVSDPNPDADEKRLKVSAIVWSTGRDGDSRTWEDNISSSSP